MNAIVRETYGPPDVAPRGSPLPTVGDGNVLVRVQAVIRERRRPARLRCVCGMCGRTGERAGVETREPRRSAVSSQTRWWRVAPDVGQGAASRASHRGVASHRTATGAAAGRQGGS